MKLEASATSYKENEARLKARIEQLQILLEEEKTSREGVEKELKEAKESVNHAQVQTAQAQIKFETIEKSHSDLLKKQNEQSAEIRELSKALAESQKLQAVAEARLEERSKS